MATAAAGKPFDRELFCKLVRLIDSTNEFERNRATGQAVQMCAAWDMRFCDAVAEVFGRDGKRVAELERQLEQARRDGDELADELKRREWRAGLRLRRQESTIEKMRLIIAALVGGGILAGWFYEFPPQHVTHRWTGYGLGLAAAPFVFLLCRWAVIRFRRRVHWRTWRDNDVFRAVARWWNRIVRKFLIAV